MPQVKVGGNPHASLAEGHKNHDMGVPMQCQIMKPWVEEAVEPLKEGVSRDAELCEVEGNEGYDL